MCRPGSPHFDAETMKKTYAQLAKQIEQLQQEAEKLRRQEMGEIIGHIREAIAHYSLTAEDLGLGPKAARGAKAAAKPAAKTRRKSTKAKTAAGRAVKFRDETGRSWGGIGKRPQWLRDALAAGKTLQDFAVQ
ncbi:MAG TPA: H-NS histone family protein [Rubrivivax sp.]|nr:H-NS histone family protein [Rubrivivax sp.]